MLSLFLFKYCKLEFAHKTVFVINIFIKLKLKKSLRCQCYIFPRCDEFFQHIIDKKN